MPREMPREADYYRTRAGASGAAPGPVSLPGRPRRPLELTDELRAALLPWIDLDEVGPEGLRGWLLTIVALVPRPRRGDHVIDRDDSRGSPEERLTKLAHALADCAGDRAVKNFQASEYFRENRVLAVRNKALEAIVRTGMATGKIAPMRLDDPAADAAAHRYLPPEKGRRA